LKTHLSRPLAIMLAAIPMPVAAQVGAQPPARVVTIHGAQVMPENLSAGSDGTLFIGSYGTGGIYRAAAGQDVATLWIAPTDDGLGRVLGLLVDEPRGQLWACTAGAQATPEQAAAPGSIRALDLATGRTLARHAFEDGGSCNDMTVAEDGTVYATDFARGRILRLRPGDTTFRTWAADARLASADGLALLDDGQLYVNTYRTGKLLRVAVQADGRAGAVTELALDRPLDLPDGMRRIGPQRLLLAEGSGRLTALLIEGDSAHVRIIRDGIPDNPSSVTMARGTVFVSQGKWAARTDPAQDGLFTVLALPLPD